MSPRLLLVPVLLFFSGGCLPEQRVVLGAEREVPGVVYLVSGVGGMSMMGPAAKLALPLAGVKHELREFSWQHGKGHMLRDLQDTENIQKKAEELAKEIRELHEREPNRRIYLVGHSAGTAIIVHACEALPPDSIERVILLSSALSPKYDLSGALRATRDMVCFYSQFDLVLLDWCTTQFGTADRIYGPAAGLSGFVPPESLDEAGKRAYQRLVQVPWTLDRALDFEGGWHHSTTLPWFLGRKVAPWLKNSEPPVEKASD
jgi:pimeloyl-ACP methyl ester carboxylesterase